MAYRYDIFLSYPHGFIERWLLEQFIPIFKWHLESALGNKPEIFIDRDGISTGDTWPLRLNKALCYSKCLLAILSPSYFQSEWCLYEITVMMKREEENGYRTPENPSGLVIPINVSDGKAFPKYMKGIQYFDFRDYVLFGPAFEKTERYIKFQQKIREWSHEIANCIEHVPNWHNSWLEQTIPDIPRFQKPKFNAPILE